MLRTSQTHPLIINEIPVSNGVLGLTFCPGKKQETSLTGGWNRDVAIDIEAIRAWRASTVISLLEPFEYQQLGVWDLPRELWSNFNWSDIPIQDKKAPTLTWVARWRKEIRHIKRRLDGGEKILIHCKGGFGRTGVVAALILMAYGHSVDEAVAMCRAARENAVENDEQLNFLRNFIV